MSYPASPDADRISIEEYLDRESVAERKHEYVAGWVYAFAGASRRHNVVVSRLLQVFLNASAGTGGQVFTSDMLVRAAVDVFYYPDITVVCDLDDDHNRYVERPCLVVEVLSPSTADKDPREKLLLYRNIESLRGYLIVAPDEQWFELHERAVDGWTQRRYAGSEPAVLPCLDATVIADELLANLPDAG